MMRWCWLAVWLAACTTPRDVYVGNDLPPAVAAHALDASQPLPSPGTTPFESAREAGSPDSAEPDAATPDATASVASSPPPPPAPDLATSRPSPCASYTADCDGDAAGGCETDLRSDRDHCGACDVACQTDECMCRDGKRVLQCRPGRADCDGLQANGCEAELQTDPFNCGVCARLCHAMGQGAMTATCSAGVCQLTCRLSAELDCDHDPENGCETQSWTDAQNCGMCGRRCFNCEFGTCMF